MIRKQVLFIHSGGSQGLHEGSNDLANYLRKVLGQEYAICDPQMPDPENPEYLTWKMILAKEISRLQGTLILVGHSLGGSVLLKYLSEESCPNPIAGLFIVAAPFWGGKGWKVEEYILKEDFYTRLPPIPKIFLYHSRPDEVVPFHHLRFYADKLPGAILREPASNRHLFSKGLPELVEDIRSTKINGQLRGPLDAERR